MLGQLDFVEREAVNGGELAVFGVACLAVRAVDIELLPLIRVGSLLQDD